MPDKRESYQPTTTAIASVAANDMPSQKSIDLLIRLLQEFDARSSSTTSNLPPEVERAVAEANAAFDSIKASLQLLESPVTIAEVVPSRGSRSGQTRVRLIGSHFVSGATVLFGTKPATEVSVGLTEIVATTPENEPCTVDVVVHTLAGAAIKSGGFTYHS
jgi:IPT/TIG domain